MSDQAILSLSEAAEALGRVREVLRGTPGSLPVVLEFHPESDTVARVKAGPSWSVDAGVDLLERLRALPDVREAEFLCREP